MAFYELYHLFALYQLIHLAIVFEDLLGNSTTTVFIILSSGFFSLIIYTEFKFLKYYLNPKQLISV